MATLKIGGELDFPAIAEAVAVCARLGAPHSVIFGGFSAEALHTRIDDAQCKVVVTTDGQFRRGKAAPLKPAVDEAVQQQAADLVFDVRNLPNPYYDPALITVPSTRKGMACRVNETKIVDQLLDGLPSGPIMAKVPRIIKVPEGEAWVSTENPLGEMGYYVVSKGDLGPFRVKIRSASFNNISIVPWVLRGVYVPDVISILASLYFILGDIDR